MEHLLGLAPIPLRVSADADPAGVDIAYSVSCLWREKGLAWSPYRMGVNEWRGITQKWKLNAHDSMLLQRLVSNPDLPEELKNLCYAMMSDGRKAEQEGWL